MDCKLEAQRIADIREPHKRRKELGAVPKCFMFDVKCYYDQIMKRRLSTRHKPGSHPWSPNREK